ncbi:hypothetical protein FYK55_02745 [Roseiconus nitratireducens]|uniref:Uncharacterized protein n=1 Tax=Roseiconus nitratireducens TaxID=2605748 RepID=A0A5M6DE98_9BACT|nr:hypothetical protein [Roseiconus nitratireducens]KAA5545857.1 hypothetical protein FYK55_02745 [Roseiconus nitratireducens]
MAKKKSTPNKSKEIRDYLKDHPGAKPREIVDAMKSKGVDVSAQFVSTVKSTSKKKKGPARRRGRPAGSKNKTTSMTRPATKKSGDTVSVESLIKLKKVVEEIGSIEEAKAALTTLEQLAK